VPHKKLANQKIDISKAVMHQRGSKLIQNQRVLKQENCPENWYSKNRMHQHGSNKLQNKSA